MKLHLPSALRRSLLSCLAFVSSVFSPSVATGSLLAAGGLVLFSLAPQAQAGATVKTTKTTERDGITYSGVILSLESSPDANNGLNISDATYTWDDGTTYVGTDKVNENGAGGGGSLWQNLFCGTSAVGDNTGTYGHTLRIASSVNGPTTFTFNFDTITLGGLIVETNTVNNTRWHTFYFNNGNNGRALYWQSNGDTILNIKSNMSFTSNGVASTSEFRNDTRWIVDSIDNSDPMHRLTWVGFKITLKGNLSIEGGGQVWVISNGIAGASTMTVDGGKTVTVDGGTSLRFMAADKGATEGGLVLGNNAKVNIKNGTISLAELTGPTSGAGQISGTSGWQFADNAKITGNIAAYADTTLSLGSSLTFSNAKLAASGDSVFTLSNASGTLSLKGDGTFNGGTIKTDGEVIVDGTLQLRTNGTIWESTNSLDLRSGSVTLFDESILKVSGKLNFGGASLSVSGGKGILEFAGSVTISGVADLGTGKIRTTGDGTITIADGSSVTISTDGEKSINCNIDLAGENSRLIITRNGLTRFTGTGGLVTGQGVLVYDFNNLEIGLGGCIDDDGYSGAAYSLGGDSGRFISATAGEMLKELRLAAGTVLSVTYNMSGTQGQKDGTQEIKFNNISRLVVDDGAAFALRAFTGTTFGSADNTLVLAGEATIASNSGQAAKNGGVYQGSLLVGADAMLTGDALKYALNSNIELLSDTGVFVALSSRDNNVNQYTLTLGSAANSGSLKAGGHVLTKRGGGILVLGQYFKTAADDTGVFDVQEGTLQLAYDEPDDVEMPNNLWNPVLAKYVVRVGADGRMVLGAAAQNDRGYVIQSLSGSGVVEMKDNSPTLVIRNQQTADNENNTFTGTIRVTNSQTLNLTLESGYQRLAAALERIDGNDTATDFALAVQVNGGVLDLSGFDDGRSDDAAISVTIGDSNARVEGLVLHMGDVLDLNAQAVTFRVTMKGGSLLNSENYTGIVTVDDSEIVNTGDYAEFDLGNLNPMARVTVHALSAGADGGSYVKAGLSMTLTGNNTITLGDYVRQGNAGFENGMFQVVNNSGSLTMDNGATLTVNIANILDSITADGVDYRISNRSIDSIFDRMSFGAELAVFNVKVEKGETTGSLRFSMLKADWDHVYQATDNNDGSEWHAGSDIYASTEPYTAVYIDRSTNIDLRGATMGSHEDGLVLKNLSGTGDGELTIEGDGRGRSLVTICNNLTDAQLEALSDEMGVDVINTLTYQGNITLSNTDLQVKHLETGSTTNMEGRLTLRGDSELMMTNGVLKLRSQGNDLGSKGVSFAGNNSQLHLEGGSARLSGNITLEAADAAAPGATQHDQHIRLTDGADLQLAGSTTVASGITIGHDDATTDNGKLSVLGNTTMGAGAVVKNVMLYLAEGSHMSVNPAAAVQPFAVRTLEPGAEWAVQGIVGSGKLSSAVQQDMTVTVRNQDCVFSGDLSGYQGSMTLTGGDHAQVFSGVLGGSGWNLTNTSGASLVLDLMGERALNSLQFGSLTLAKDSSTSILMDLANAVRGKGVNMDSFDYTAGAAVTVGHHQGSVRLDGADADGMVDLVIGHVDNWGSSDKDLSSWTVTGVRNMRDEKTAEVYVDSDGTIHARVMVENTNTWEARTSGENAGAGANLLWGVKDTGAIGGDLAALDTRIYSLIGGSNWKTPGNMEEASRILAAAAGASTAVVGQAIAGDVDRQMRTIRNRTTSMGYTELDTPQSAELPHWSAWLNAESYYHTQKEDGLMPGYKLNSWGGTVGTHVDTDTDTTLGLALTAMYGDLESQGPDTLKGDLATYYVSGFARMASGAWLHTVVCTLGLAQLDAERTVRYDESAAYTTSGSTQGWSLGLMYEVGYSIAMNEYGTVCLQPVANVAWRHTMINAYTESGSTAALEVDKQTYSTLTFGMGARMQSTMGDRVFNGAGLLEARALLKLELGDRQGESSVSFARAAEGSATVKGSERGVAGLELGAGVCLPVSDAGSEIFADVSAEVRSNATELNATLGYRFSF